MRCEQLMKSDVEFISPEDTITAAATRMRDCNIGFLPVCDRDGRVVGTLTDRDIATRVVAAGLPGRTPVSQVMTDEVVACHPHDEIREAERLMAGYHKSRIVCVDNDDHVVGVISLSDLAQHEVSRAMATVLRKVTEREAAP
jgi:CBS domain-containing protein